METIDELVCLQATTRTDGLVTDLLHHKGVRAHKLKRVSRVRNREKDLLTDEWNDGVVKGSAFTERQLYLKPSESAIGSKGLESDT